MDFWYFFRIFSGFYGGILGHASKVRISVRVKDENASEAESEGARGRRGRGDSKGEIEEG